MGKIRVLVGCQNEFCAEEVSYHLDMVKMWKDQPVCQNCYDEDGIGMTGEEFENRQDWSDLPKISVKNLCS